VSRLYSLGYADDVSLGMRPWTRVSSSHMLEDITAETEDANSHRGAPVKPRTIRGSPGTA
jgi:hypothetical protein